MAPKSSNPLSETMTPQSGSIGVSDMNVATRQYVDATLDGRSEPNRFAGFQYNSNTSIGTLKDWFGGLYRTGAGHGTASLICGPHSGNTKPGWDAHNATNNTVPAGGATGAGSFRDYTPITVMTRAKCRSQNGSYYNGNNGMIALRVYGGVGITQIFSVNIAGVTKKWASNTGPGSWWSGLGSAQQGWNAYRVTISWTVGSQTASIGNINIGIGVEKDGTAFFGRYGWSSAHTYHLPSQWVANYLGSHYSAYTTKWSLFNTGTSSEMYVTGGGQANPFTVARTSVGWAADVSDGTITGTGANASEFFWDWFNVTSRNKLRMEFASDDKHSIWIYDVWGNQVFHKAESYGGFGDTTPKRYDFTPPYAGNFQIQVQVFETGGGETPVWVGGVIWDHVKYGNAGPPIIASAKAGHSSGSWHGSRYSVSGDDNLIWSTRKNLRYTANGSGTGSGVFHHYPGTSTVASSTDWSGRVWWMPQQNYIRQE